MWNTIAGISLAANVSNRFTREATPYLGSVSKATSRRGWENRIG
jgi:hypothetical protein